MDDNHNDRRPTAFRVVEYMFEATDFEQNALWERWHTHIVSWDERPNVDLPSIQTVGRLAGHDINVQFTWVRLNGHLVGFYDPCSRVVDHTMVDEWVDTNVCPPHCGRTRRRQDASNFRNGLLDLGIPWTPFK